MFIQTEDTPNPATMKFLPSRLVVEKPIDMTDAAQAAVSPLAQALFEVPGVKGVFLGRDFISVTKADDAEWPLLRPEILAAIMDHFMSDRPVLAENAEEGGCSSSCCGACSCHGPCDDETVIHQIRELLDKRIRPAVAQDGGDVSYEGYKDGVVFLKLKGACAGCPSATATLKFGIEQMLRHFIPEVKEVKRVG